MQPVLSEVIARRRDRAIAVLLGVKEREIDQFLPPEAKSLLRKAILDQMNDFHAFVVDVMRSLDTGEVIVNELYMEKLDGLSREFGMLRQQLVSSPNGNGR